MNSRYTRKSKTKVRSTGLAEALWACVLDDYLSEEEEGEFGKIVGKKEPIPWWQFEGSKPRTHHLFEDPRDAKARGGSKGVVADNSRDGTPGVWSNDVTPEMPPVMWLEVPPSQDEKEQRMSRPNWDTDGQPNLPRTQSSRRKARNEQGTSSGENRARRQVRQLDPRPPKSKAGSKAGSKTNSRASSRTSSRASSRVNSRPTPLSESRPRVDPHLRADTRSYTDSISKEESQSLVDSRSLSRVQSTRSKSRSKVRSGGRQLIRVRSEHRQPGTGTRE